MALVGCGKNKKEDLITTWTSDPSNPQNVIVEAAIREELKKPSGELTKADLEKGLEKLTQLKELSLNNNPDLTKAQIDQLKKALPKCYITSNPTK